MVRKQSAAQNQKRSRRGQDWPWLRFFGGLEARVNDDEDRPVEAKDGAQEVPNSWRERHRAITKGIVRDSQLGMPKRGHSWGRRGDGR